MRLTSYTAECCKCEVQRQRESAVNGQKKEEQVTVQVVKALRCGVIRAEPSTLKDMCQRQKTISKLLWAKGTAEAGEGGRTWCCWACLTFLEASSPRCRQKDKKQIIAWNLLELECFSQGVQKPQIFLTKDDRNLGCAFERWCSSQREEDLGEAGGFRVKVLVQGSGQKMASVVLESAHTRDTSAG